MAALLPTLFVLGCVTTSGGESSPPAGDGGPPSGVELTWSVAEVPGLTLAAMATVSLDRDWEVAVVVVDPEGRVRRTEWSRAAREHQVPVLGLRADTTYELRAIYRDKNGMLGAGDWLGFTTGALPSGISGLEFSPPAGEVGDEGVTLFAPSPVAGSPSIPYVLGVDGEGQLVYYYDDPELAGSLIANRNVRVLPSGELGVVLEGGFRTFWPTGDTTLEIARPYLHHDAVVLPGGHVLALVYEDREVVDAISGEVTVVRGDVVIEVTPDNELVWSWNSLDALDTGRVGEGFIEGENESVYDWTHANALDYDAGSGTILVSMRNQNWVVVIDHATGEVLELLGDQGTRQLGEGDWFHLQHGAEFVEGGLTVFDNGLDESLHSRGLRYSLVDGEPTLEEVWNYDVGFYARTMGEVDLLSDGSYLVTVGTSDVVGQDAELRRGFYRVDASGLPVWTLTIAHEGRFEIFRADRVYWLVELSADEAAIP